MAYIVLSLIFVVSLIASFLLGYRINQIAEKVKRLEMLIQSVTSSKSNKKEDEPKSVLIDPDDIAAKIKREHEELLRKLNP